MNILDDLSITIPFVHDWLGHFRPQLAIVLGSGLSGALEQFSPLKTIQYSEIPNFSTSGVIGHAGLLHCGTLYDQQVLIFQGRFHVYEGFSAWQTTAPVRLAAAVGCKKILLTNAAGGLAEQMQPGDFMLVEDHFNLTGINPLCGRPEREFLDLTNLYRCDFYPELRQQLLASEFRLHLGSLAWMPGPCYETAAEIRLLGVSGASAVSMSTVHEAIIARRYGLETVAISSISNLAAGKTSARLDHLDVLASGERSATSLQLFLGHLFNLWIKS